MKIFLLWNVYYLFLLILIRGGCSEMTGTVHYNATWQSAVESCSRNQGRLLGGSSPEGNKELQNMLERSHYKRVWTDIKIKRFQALTWMNESSIEGRIFHKRDAKCGCADLFDMELYEYPCTESHHFFCEFQSCQKCPKGEIHETCLAVEGSCYFVSNTTANWFEARNKCLSRGRDLAVIDTNRYLNELNDAVWMGTGIRSLWMGLRTVDWFSQGKAPERYYWLDGQPDVSNDCVVLTRYQERFGWKTYQCHETANFVCQNQEASTPGYQKDLSAALLKGTRYQTHTQSSGEAEMQNNAPDHKVATGTTLGILFPVLAVSAFILCIYHEKILTWYKNSSVYNKYHSVTLRNS